MKKGKARKQHEIISRREFMVRTGLLASLALAYPAAALAELRKAKQQSAIPEWTTDPAWQTITQVQDILFPPGEGVPGASDFGADVYLQRAIENPAADGDDKDFIMRGVGWLEDLTQQQYNKTFVQLTVAQQQETITQIVGSRAGRNWVSTPFWREACGASPTGCVSPPS